MTEDPSTEAPEPAVPSGAAPSPATGETVAEPAEGRVRADVVVRAARTDSSLTPRLQRRWSPALIAVRRRLVDIRDHPAALLTASAATVGAGLAVGMARQLLSSSGSGRLPAGPVAMQLSGVVEVVHKQINAPQIVQHVVHHVVHHHVHHYPPRPPLSP